MFEVISIEDKNCISKAKDILFQNKPICAPTDTIYGLLALDNDKALDYLYKIRRPSKRPFLRLLPDLSYLKFYGFSENKLIKPFIDIDKVSIIIEEEDKSLGFRIPKKGFIRNLLQEIKTPILAPSCNKEHMPPANSIPQAIEYFSDEIPLYIDAKVIDSPPSTIIHIKNNHISIVREGAFVNKVRELIKDLS